MVGWVFNKNEHKTDQPLRHKKKESYSITRIFKSKKE